MNFERVLALVIVLSLIFAVLFAAVLFFMSHPWIAGISLYVALTSLVLLFIRGATARKVEIDELQTVRR